MQNNQKEIPFELSDYALKKYFCDAATRQGWLNFPAVAVAVSGGGDSIALLWLCRKFFAGRVVAIHINHGIRGQESDGDEDFTRDFARSIGAEFYGVSVSVPTLREKGESLETTARRLRLENISATARRLGINAVLLGHNRDDLAETVLFNIIRGTGIRGSVGMTEHSEINGVNFFRPLLGMRREFLREILRVRGLTWREDSTNASDEYTRNFIRLKLLPTINANINASAVEHLASFGEDMRKIREREDNESKELLQQCAENNYTLNRRFLRKLDADSRALVIREVGRKLRLKTLSRERTEILSGLIVKGEKFIFQWCKNFNVTGKGDKIFFGVKNYE